MPVKDRIVTWFIKNIYIPKREIIDKPGFIINTVTKEDQTTYLREFFLPERLIELIENNIVKNYGDTGRKTLYSIGKKFGYAYSSMSIFPNRVNNNEKELKDFIYLFVRYCESTYAKRADYQLDLDKKIFTIDFNDYIICRHNGLGYIMTDGGTAGIWSYIMQDEDIEAIQLECEGRKNQKCFVFCAPSHKIKEKKVSFYRECKLPDIKFDETYKSLNEIQQTTYAINSLQDLIDTGFIKYANGIMSFKEFRLFSADSHLLYIIEEEISKLNNGEKILFEACFEFGKELQKICGEKDYKKFIMDFFPAIGFGEILIKKTQKIEVICGFYPWTSLSENCSYIIFRGILSGFISNSINENVELINSKTTVSSYLTLTFISN